MFLGKLGGGCNLKVWWNRDVPLFRGKFSSEICGIVLHQFLKYAELWVTFEEACQTFGTISGNYC